MPHASGGGSAHGGSHSSHRSSASHFHTHTYRPGTIGYTFTDKKGKEHVFYRKEAPKPRTLWRSFISNIPMLVIGSLLCIFAIFETIYNPIYLFNTEQYFTGTYIEDIANILDDSEEDELIQTLESFRTQTGVIPYVYTTTNEALPSTYFSDIEDYAYDTYVQRFNDECHFLIVYTQDQDDASDWYWIAMQGNYTDNLVTESNFDTFQTELQSYLEDTNVSLGLALNQTFETSLTYMNHPSIIRLVFYILYHVAAIAFGLYLLFIMIQDIRNQIEINQYFKSKENIQ